MKIRSQLNDSTVELEDPDMMDDQEPKIIGQKEVENVTVLDVRTPSGRDAIAFTSPISDKEIIILKPSTRDMINIERDMKKNHKDGGNFESAVVMIVHLLVGYGDKKGEKIVTFNRVVDAFQLEEVMLITSVLTECFFSSDTMTNRTQ
jgi:hypothetical protein